MKWSRFVPAQLEAVARLYRAQATRDKTLAVVKERFMAALEEGAHLSPVATKGRRPAIEPGHPAWHAWHDAMVAMTLRQRLEGTRDLSFTELSDGSFALVRERSLTEEIL